MKESGITGRAQLKKADPGLFQALRRRKLLSKVAFEQKMAECRAWKSMPNSQLIQRVRSFMKETGITGRTQLQKADSGFYSILRQRKLLDKVGFEQKRREPRDWSSMRDGEFIQHALDFMKEKGIAGRTQLSKADPGLYQALYHRDLLSIVFFGIEQAKKQSLESELVSELRKAADAMAEFGGEKE
jgi:hypothetical protein